jgi:hypothetical protein
MDNNHEAVILSDEESKDPYAGKKSHRVAYRAATSPGSLAAIGFLRLVGRHGDLLAQDDTLKSCAFMNNPTESPRYAFVEQPLSRVIQRLRNHHLRERFGEPVLRQLRAGKAAIQLGTQALKSFQTLA